MKIEYEVISRIDGQEVYAQTTELAGEIADLGDEAEARIDQELRNFFLKTWERKAKSHV